MSKNKFRGDCKKFSLFDKVAGKSFKTYCSINVIIKVLINFSILFFFVIIKFNYEYIFYIAFGVSVLEKASPYSDEFYEVM